MKRVEGKEAQGKGRGKERGEGRGGARKMSRSQTEATRNATSQETPKPSSSVDDVASQDTPPEGGCKEK